MDVDEEADPKIRQRSSKRKCGLFHGFGSHPLRPNHCVPERNLRTGDVTRKIEA
jgi:hypothetical protein